MPTINPATEEVITTIVVASPHDVSAAIEAANAAFRAWTRLRGSERAKLLHRVADLIEQYAHELGYRETVDMGKLYRDVTTIDIPHIANMFRYYAGWTTKIEGAVKPVEPVPGFEGNLMAFTGNCIIHRPSSSTSLTSLLLAQIMAEAGIPDDVYNTITGPGSNVGDQLIKSPGIEKVAFTGSMTVGRQLAKDASDTLKHVTLELGGKSPNVIMADANIDAAVAIAFFGMFWNKSEVCVAGSRVLVQETILDEVVEKLKSWAVETKTGNPLDLAKDMGPLADEHEYAKTLKYIEIGKNEIGAGSGLGTALAHRFGREGMRVALVARQEASLAAALTAEGITAKSFVADAGDPVLFLYKLFFP